jgi:hypothetical protein
MSVRMQSCCSRATASFQFSPVELFKAIDYTRNCERSTSLCGAVERRRRIVIALSRVRYTL